jgi:TDG/mug DNA glycosylase family protein
MSAAADSVASRRTSGSAAMGHRVREMWMEEEVETLEDLLRPGLRAVCVGINPAPRSVAAGHYYQGQLGQMFFKRLRLANILPTTPGWEDDVAYAGGIGFTDIVKRPTEKAADVGIDEFAYGKPLLENKLEAAAPQLLIFSFKKTAEILFGKFAGNGFIGRRFGGAEVFVMPGPYAKTGEVRQQLDELMRSAS